MEMERISIRPSFCFFSPRTWGVHSPAEIVLVCPQPVFSLSLPLRIRFPPIEFGLFGFLNLRGRLLNRPLLCHLASTLLLFPVGTKRTD